MAHNGVIRLIAVGAVGILAAATLTGTTAPAAAKPALDRKQLQRSLDDVRDAGMYGIYSVVRDGNQTWKGASGIADVKTRRPVKPNMEHRIGSITKSFIATGILQQVERGRVTLDAPIAKYLPDLVPGERGQKITVRMLLNHTSGIGDYIGGAFPTLGKGDPQSLADNQFRTFQPRELITFGLAEKPTGEPGAKASYSNTNYILAGQLLERVTGMSADKYLAHQVIARAGLTNTYLPTTPYIRGKHSGMYENYYGRLNPPKDYSVYNPSGYGTAGAMISTMDDLNTFFRALLDGKLISAQSLKQMMTTVPLTDENGNVIFRYGLGIYSTETSCGTFWGHAGGVWGATTEAAISADRKRQAAYGMNLKSYHRLDENNMPLPHPIDPAIEKYNSVALCGKVGQKTIPAAPSIRSLIR